MSVPVSEQETFAPNPLSISLGPPLTRPSRSFKLDCLTPDKQPRVEQILSGEPKFESGLYAVWENKDSNNYFVLSKINDDFYVISAHDINDCMGALGCYYTKLSIEIFEVLVKYDFHIGNTIAEFMWRYQ